MTEPIIRAAGITKIFSTGAGKLTALEDLSIDLQRGEFARFSKRADFIIQGAGLGIAAPEWRKFVADRSAGLL